MAVEIGPSVVGPRGQPISPGRGDAGGERRRPVFVAGPDRSGTTLMYALLASHPDLSMVRRTNMWRYFYGRYGNLSSERNLERCLDEMVGFRRMRILHPDRERIRREFLGVEPTYGNLFALFHEHHAQRAGKQRWGDKSLHTEHYADDVFREFPDAHIVHMMRDPRDRYASIIKRWDRDRSGVEGVTGRWLASTRAGRRNEERHPGRCLIVRYEDLVADPETTMRSVCDVLGLDFEPAMLSLDGVPEVHDRGGNSSYGERDPGTITTRSVGRFRDVVPPPELAFLQRAAAREMARFGYEAVEVPSTRAQRARFAIWSFPRNRVRMRAGMVLESLGRRRGEQVPAEKRAGTSGLRVAGERGRP
jgi:Sulfotransferase family